MTSVKKARSRDNVRITPVGQVIEQQIVPFLGDDLAAALTPGGIIYISLPGMCKALGLLTRGQIRRIRDTKSLSKGLRRIPIVTAGGNQRLNCLRVDKVALWLAGVQTNSMKSDEFRFKIETYQDELAPAATQVLCGSWVYVPGILPRPLTRR